VLGSWPRKVQTQSSSLQSLKNWRLKSRYMSIQSSLWEGGYICTEKRLVVSSKLEWFVSSLTLMNFFLVWCIKCSKFNTTVYVTSELLTYKKTVNEINGFGCNVQSARL
jgi:hypothetical protein